MKFADLGDVDLVGFSVGGSFAGILNATDFDASSSAVTGENHLLVGGKVTQSARFNIGDIASTSAADIYSFGDAFLGQLNIGGNLDVDLAFAGSVNRLTIGGAVLDTISVGGRLNFLSSGSLFTPTTPGVDGNFVDGNGTVTGNLDTTNGFATVTPRRSRQAACGFAFAGGVRWSAHPMLGRKIRTCGDSVRQCVEGGEMGAAHPILDRRIRTCGETGPPMHEGGEMRAQRIPFGVTLRRMSDRLQFRPFTMRGRT